MSLRRNTILKILALLLFTVEFLAPAFLIPEYPSDESEVKAFQKSHNQCIALTLLAEEAGGEEEREGKDQKAFLTIDFNLEFLFHADYSITRVSLASLEHHYHYNNQLPLFKLYHVYRV